MSTPKKRSKQPSAKPLSLRLDDDLLSSLEAAEEETNLSRSDLARLSIERGLKLLLAQLKSVPSEATTTAAAA